jgi:hypothetical protein
MRRAKATSVGSAAWFVATAVLATIPWLVLAVGGYAAHSWHTGLQHPDPGGPTGPHIHWAKDGRDHAYANFVDYSGDNWPVQAKVGLWNDANHIEADYKAPSDFCGDHCVSVTANSFDEGCHTLSGLASLIWDGDGHEGGQTKIQYNTKCNSAETDFYRAKITCQELGHVVGALRHRGENSTCMHQNASEATQASPDNHDYDTLQSHIYG